ncbi:Fic family protein [Rhodococcus qingshengii]|uniref:Fic family protein n=1 Tax=Rhodococcus qingshengii TaxID=334542 RepID=A0AAW6LKK8_RHOSG|nr:Fic family protein [Rhodococcus qingshengii]MDE8647509.1 Fic family protein [Rhodococcus qingshengii]
MSMDGLNFFWDRRAIPTLPGGISRDEIAHTLAHNLADCVWNTAALEGNSFTIREVKSLMDGEQVAGHPISEVRQIADTAEAYTWLLAQVRTDSLDWDRETSDHSNGILARHEALVAGQFRTSEVSVHLGARGAYTPPPVGDLEDHYRAGIWALGNIDRPDERALAYFAFGARAQFYFDGNKRTSRHLMNAILMAAGHHPIVVPVARELEFDEACVSMFADADATEIMQFLASCTA